jgi:hypothetical protein
VVKVLLTYVLKHVIFSWIIDWLRRLRTPRKQRQSLLNFMLLNQRRETTSSERNIFLRQSGRA